MKAGKFLLYLFATIFLTNNVLPQKAENFPLIKYKQITLKNGLRVVLHEDHSTPVVAVNFWYHVGSKDEAPGKTGFAHLFEHMMFQGSKNYDFGYNDPILEAGGILNGNTNQDRTYYYEAVPSNFLELALSLESDRMSKLTEAITQEKLDNQREVVKNEWRQKIENEPYGAVFENMLAGISPVNHPYHHSVFGSIEDLSTASLNDVRSFFRRYYLPNNATLVLSGDFNEKQAVQWIEKYFSPIAKGTDISHPNAVIPKLNGEIRKEIEAPVALPAVYLVWSTTPLYSNDSAALSMLGEILSRGRNSRFQSNLIYDKKITEFVSAANNEFESGGFFVACGGANPGKSLDEIEKEINIEIERIKNQPPTDEEVHQALTNIEVSNIYSLETALDKGKLLSTFDGYLKNPGYLQKFFESYRKVTSADIQRVANKYLTGNRFVMNYVPRKNAPPASEASSASTKKKTVNEDLIAEQKARLPKPGANPKITLPPIEKTKLSNGLEVWLVRRNKLPIVSINMIFKSGGALEPAGKSGTGQLTAKLLTSGTKNRSAAQIAPRLSSMGIAINSNSSWDFTQLSLKTLSKNLDESLDIYADVITNPIFPDSELESNRRRLIANFSQQKITPNSTVIFNHLLYGAAHPYGKPLTGNEKSVKSITRDDIVKYYESTYRPDNAVLIITGDIEKNLLMPKLDKAFSGWKSSASASGKMPTSEIVQPETIQKTNIYIVDTPGATQSEILIGQIGSARDTPDYYALQVMNSILGDDVSSRINMNLRQDKGYTYNARSSFTFRRRTGAFMASAGVQTAVTKESVAEFMKELNGIRGMIPITQKELDYNKQSIINRYPRNIETVEQVAGQLSNLVIYGLPDNYLNTYTERINAVTVADVNCVANKYLTPDKIAIVIVGDRNAIEPKLQQLGYPIIHLDTDGNPLP